MTARCIDPDDEAHGLGRPLAYSLASHVLFVCLVIVAQAARPTGPVDPRRALGYWDRMRQSGDLDLRQANALRFRFFQPPGGSAGGAPQRARPQAAETRSRAEKQAGIARRRAAAATGSGVRSGVRQPRQAERERAAAAPSDAGIVVPPLQPDVSLSNELAIIEFVKPIYPERELQAGISARIVVALHVNGLGEIDEAVVQESTTSPPASPRAFELTALEALRRWRIRLPRAEQYREGCWLRVPIEYNPEDEDFDLLGPSVRIRPAPNS